MDGSGRGGAGGWLSTDRRPPVRPWHAVTGLDHFALVSWAVDPDRMAAALPSGFEPLRFGLDDGATALASAVSFLDRDFRFRFFPWVRLSCGQINYRLYVRRTAGADAGTTGVLFVGTSLDSRLVAVARLLWSMPWHRDTIRIDGSWAAGRCDRLEVSATGDWGRAAVALGGTGALDDPDRLAPVRGAAVTDPLIGWYVRRDGALGRYTVWHPPLPLRGVGIAHGRARVFEDLGLTDPGAAPIDALVARTVEFDVHTPPRRQR